MADGGGEAASVFGGGVEVVECFGHEQIGVGIKAFGEFVALVAQVAFYFKVDVVVVAVALSAQAASEFFAQPVFGKIGDVPHHAGDAQASAGDGLVLGVIAVVEIGVGDDGLAGNVVEGDVLGAELGGGGDDEGVADAFGEIDCPLQCLHSAEAAADNGCPLADAETVGEQGLGAHPVAHGNDGKGGAVGFAGGGVGAGGTGAAGAAAKVVEGDNEKFVGVYGFAAANHVVPPAGVFVICAVAAGGVVGAGKGVADEDGVGFVFVGCAVGFGDEVEAGERAAVLQEERVFKRDGLGGNEGVAVDVHGGAGFVKF